MAYSASQIDRAADRATVLADGGYQGTGLLIPHRRRAGQSQLTGWKERDNTDHRRIRARVEHTFAAMKTFKILRGWGRHHRAVRTVLPREVRNPRMPFPGDRRYLAETTMAVLITPPATNQEVAHPLLIPA